METAASPQSFPGRVAVLAGTPTHPVVRLTFSRNALHPTATYKPQGERHTKPMPLTEWVKRAPDRHWDGEEKCWVITGFGWSGLGIKPGRPAPDRLPAGAAPRTWPRMLREAGFDIVKELDEPNADLVWPLVKGIRGRHGLARVYPRLAGWQATKVILGPAATWDKGREAFTVPMVDLLDIPDHPDVGIVDQSLIETAIPRPGIRISESLLAHARDRLRAPETEPEVEKAAALAARSSGTGLTESQREVVGRLGEIAEWFGLDLYPYQRLGALATAAGHTYLTDPPGLGKTRSVLAAFATAGSQRAILIVPPVAITGWTNETRQANLAGLVTRPAKACDPDQWRGERPHDDAEPYRLVVFKAGRKEPDLPQRGVVIVPDSLLAERPHLTETLAAWAPDAIAYDEVHRARTWDARRAVAARDLIAAVPAGGLRIPATGTPLFGSPADLASQLAISGHLDWLFGGCNRFIDRYCTRDFFGGLHTNSERLAELNQILTDHVWVRRNKAEVLPDLPQKARYAQSVDVDLRDYRAAHASVIATITEWLDGYVAAHGGAYPDEEEIAGYARRSIGLMSPLRKAAGLAKVPHVLDLVRNWIAAEYTPGEPCDRPLLVWAHHQEVVDALRKTVGEEVGTDLVAVIDGGTSVDNRGRLTARFQAGELPVLICSITAAGVAITLTRGSDAYFVEADWSPNNISQAEDRQNRIGATRASSNTFLLAEGTLDGHIQAVLERKSEIIAKVTGDDLANVSVLGADDRESAAEIIALLVGEAMKGHGRAGTRRRAA